MSASAWMSPSSYSQVVNNNGSTANIKPGLIVNIQGAASNNGTGTVINEGTLIVRDDFTNNATTQGSGLFRISGDWVNNASFTADASDVMLEGGDQYIKGTTQSDFYNLELKGAGTKTLGINASSSGILALNDRELATDANTFMVNNTSLNAITRTSGFVSSQGNGSLSRVTGTAAAYLFPVGSSAGTARYRPVEITPGSAATHTYTVGLYNYNASFDGYDISQATADICGVSSLFYHRINRITGTDPATVSIFFDGLLDDGFTGLANWKSGQWEGITGVLLANGALSSLTKTGWNDFSSDPYITTKLCSVTEPGSDAELYIYNTFTPDEDGKNDTWQIDNIDQFPDNEVEVYNRWGGLVFRAAPYQNDWDGTINGKKLPVSAYYYVLKLGNDAPAHTGTVNITR